MKKIVSLILLCTLLFALFSVPDPALASGSGWNNIGGNIPGVSGTVNAVAISPTNGSVVVGGLFNFAGDNRIYTLARWDGSDWTALGTGFPSGSIVYALAFDSSGNLYVGGKFTKAGGISVNNVARWNEGTLAWSAMGSGLSGTVRSLLVDSSNNVVAGGAFSGGIKLARWNGSTWSTIGSAASGTVYALALSASNQLIAAGDFAQMGGGSSVNYVASWNGIKWSGMAAKAKTNALVVDAAGVIYAGGEGFVSRWTGSGWSSLGGNSNTVKIYSLAKDSSNRIVVGGLFTSIGGKSANNIARWSSASGWTTVGGTSPGTNGVVNALAVFGTSFYSGGIFTVANNLPVSNVVLWEGSGAIPLTNDLNATIWTSASDSAGNVYFGGDFVRVPQNRSVGYAGKWSPADDSWTELGSGTNGAIVAMAVDSGDNLYAGGVFTTAGGKSANRIAKWNGTNWSSMASGANGIVFTLAAVSPTRIYAGGTFTTMGSINASKIARWNGTSWDKLGKGTSGTVYALAVDSKGNVYAGGYFQTAGGEYVSNIAKWDGSVWTALGSGTSGTVRAIKIDADDNVYVGGLFTRAGGLVVNGLAKWDGTSWSSIGTGVTTSSITGTVYNIQFGLSNELIVGGTFTNAGGIVVNNVAMWDELNGWQTLDTGLKGAVYGMSVSNSSNLYVAGSFTYDGAKTKIVNRAAFIPLP